MFVTHRLETASGTVYSVGEDWPIPLPKKYPKLSVGMIFWRPEEVIPVNIEDEDETSEGSETKSEHYEVWGMTEQLAEVFAKMQAGVAVTKGELEVALDGPVIQCIVHLDSSNVRSSENTWSAMSAFKVIAERGAEQLAAVTDEPTNGQAQATATPG